MSVLGALFCAAVLLANVISGKLCAVGPLTLSAGMLVFPLVFVLTDAMHDRYGTAAVRHISWVAAGLQVLAYGLIQVAMALPVAAGSPVSQGAFQQVFGSSLWVFAASLVAFVLGQQLDVWVFNWLRQRTGNRHLWLRATGSTVISQALDTAVFVGLAFGPHVPWPVMVQVMLANYGVKVLLAVGCTPFCYGLRKLAVASGKALVFQSKTLRGGSSVG
jgi:queuosine precursor transporter